MSTLVEQIEALQLAIVKIGIQLESTNAIRGRELQYLAQREIGTILAAARAQEKELADLHVASDMVAMELAAKQEELAALKGKVAKWFAEDMPTEEDNEADKDVADAVLRTQHSADLLAIAELAIEAVGKYMDDFRKWDEDIDSLPESVPIFPTADSILAAFREKQKKAEVGK